MAPARAGGRMGGCETTPPASRTDRGRQQPHAYRTPQLSRLSPLAIIGRRLPASSSFLLAAARLRGLQLDPGPRGRPRTRQLRGKPAQQSSQPRSDYQVTGPGQRALFTATAPMDVNLGGPRRSLSGAVTGNVALSREPR